MKIHHHHHHHGARLSERKTPPQLSSKFHSRKWSRLSPKKSRVQFEAGGLLSRALSEINTCLMNTRTCLKLWSHNSDSSLGKLIQSLFAMYWFFSQDVRPNIFWGNSGIQLLGIWGTCDFFAHIHNTWELSTCMLFVFWLLTIKIDSWRCLVFEYEKDSREL